MKTKQTLLQEGEKGFREGSVEEFLMQRWHLRHQAPGKGKAHRSQRDSSCLCLHDPEYSERVNSSYLRSSTKSKSSTHTGQ